MSRPDGSDASPATLGALLGEAAARHGERPALRFEGRSWSYAELHGEVQRLARALVGAGVVKGARLGLLMANRPEWVVAAFAAGLVGAVLVPVNTFATPEERDHVLRHGDVALLLLQRALLGRDLLAELVDRHPCVLARSPGRLRVPALPQLRRVVVLGGGESRGGVEPWEALLGLGDDVPGVILEGLAVEVAPSDDGVLVYTSGTTERPKGVLHRQRAPVLQGRAFAALMGLGPEDRVFSAQPLFWTAGMAMSLCASVAAGACLLLQETFEAGAALDLVERERATAVHAWPHQEKAMAEHPSAAGRDLSALRRVEFGSPLARLAGLERDEWGIHASYGLSESFTIVSALPASAPAGQRRASNGPALPGVTLRIVDPETGAPLPAGERGEIAVRGPTLMRGYQKGDPELAFDAEGFFRTGDAGWLDEAGRLHWTGRLSGIIKTGGANVSPLEVEKVAAELPGVRAAAAVGVPHPSLGEALVLCVVPTAGARPIEDGLREALRARLAAYKVPRRVLVFGDDEVDWTGTQKLRADALRAAALRRLEEEGAAVAGFRYGGTS
jgi:acyl-CoA synthetase (AMP-forming)/AMP-acid ligase II